MRREKIWIDETVFGENLDGDSKKGNNDLVLILKEEKIIKNRVLK